MLEETWGHFEGEVDVRWLGDGRTMVLERDFRYVDPAGVIWDAPAGSLTDGASIPWALWSVVGGPYEGPYRLASIPHDVECGRKVHPWRVVHRMFYEACRCAGVGEFHAKVLYAGVLIGGPRWPLSVALPPPKPPAWTPSYLPGPVLTASAAARLVELARSVKGDDVIEDLCS